MHLRRAHGAESFVGNQIHLTPSVETTERHNSRRRDVCADLNESLQKKFGRCHICNARVKVSRLRGHISRVHGEAFEAVQQHVSTLSYVKRQRISAESKSSSVQAHSPKRVRLPKLRIYDHHGRRTSDVERCDACRARAGVAYRYLKTNYGEVTLCSRCRDTALSKRGNPDAFHRRYR
jgi:hypothetical protein